MQHSFVLSFLFRLRQAKQTKMASKKVDVWGHVLRALPAAGFGSDSVAEVAMCVFAYVCVCTCWHILMGDGGSGREHRQQIKGPMPGEIMTPPNRILGNGGDKQ